MLTRFSEVTLNIIDGDSCYQVTVPGISEEDGIEFLEAVGSGLLGAGFRMTQLGRSLPALRMEYESRLAVLNSEIKAKQGIVAEADLKKWASDERTKIARAIRQKQGPIAQAVLEFRDWKEFGLGGRTEKNIYARDAKNPNRSPKDFLKKATKSNKQITENVIRGARMLKGVGRVFFFVGLGMSVSAVALAKPSEREKVAKEEAVHTAGSMLGLETGVAVCLAFSITSGGWGLFGCGLVGGAAGGYAADRIVYPVHPNMAARELEMNGILTSPFLLWPHHADRWAS
ncbi:MAG: hypothetical protein HY308_00545 [Gammaproteobacteria bacterium]|nr:hypothetical protein [Gammaproteobacteria bacterium]